jgi:hypothetical protein
MEKSALSPVVQQAVTVAEMDFFGDAVHGAGGVYQATYAV